MDLTEIGWISSGFLEGVIKNAPMILGAILIVVVGYLIALGVKRGVRGVFKRVKFDEFCKK
jgi:Conserved TM helix.